MLNNTKYKYHISNYDSNLSFVSKNFDEDYFNENSKSPHFKMNNLKI